MANNYYWRAVRRLAKSHGVSISRARKMDWEKEANAERKRRSESRILSHVVRYPGKTTSKTSSTRIPTPRSKAPTGKGKRVVPKRGTPVPSRVPTRKLEFRDYDRIPTRGEEEFDEAEDWEQQWEDEWEGMWEELNDLDDLDGFLEDFEHEDSDKYKEPA